MFSKCFVMAAALTALTTPAWAQGVTQEYYVVQDVQTKKCTIVTEKPTTTTVVQVGPGAFKTRTEAETGMRAVKVCTPD